MCSQITPEAPRQSSITKKECLSSIRSETNQKKNQDPVLTGFRQNSANMMETFTQVWARLPAQGIRGDWGPERIDTFFSF